MRTVKVRNIFSLKGVSVLLGLLLLGAFFPVLLGGETFCYRDFGVMAIPTAWFHRAMIWNGEIPLWNPYSNCGVPFLAQWGTMVLYPPSLIYVLLPMPWSLNLFCIAHLWLGGMGMYCLARKWVSAEWPAGLAAIIFTFNGITQAALSWPNYTAALGLFPWVVLTIERAWEVADSPGALRTRAHVLACVIAAMQLLTGVPEISVFTWIILGVTWLCRFRTEAGHRKGLVISFAAVVAGATVLCAAQLLPFFELLEHSQRTPGFAAEKWSLTWLGWANFILPRFHTLTTPEGTVFQYSQQFLSSTYAGAPALILAIVSFCYRSSRRWALGGIVVGAAVLALGSAGLFYALLLKLFPFLGVARYPVKFLFLVSFALPLLSALGLRQLMALPAAEMRRVLWIGAAAGTALMGVLVWMNYAHPFQYDRLSEFRSNSLVRWFFLVAFLTLLWIVPRLSEHYAKAAKLGVIVIIALDYMVHLGNQNPTVSASIFTPGLWNQSAGFIKPEHGNGRIFITPLAEERILHSGIPGLRDDLIGKRLALWSHLNLLERVPKVNGSATLQLREQAAVQSSLYSKTNAATERWLDFLNVTLSTSSNSVVEWQARSSPMPFITAGQKSVRAGADFIANPISFGREVALAPLTAGLEGRESTAVELTNIEIGVDELSFTARSDVPTVAVISATWHPGWKADVLMNGGKASKVTVLKANYAFQAIPLPAGSSKVRVYYGDTRFYIGAAVSVAGLLAGAVACLAKEKRSSRY